METKTTIIILISLAAAVFLLLHLSRKNRNKKAFEDANLRNSFTPDYIDCNQQIAIESVSKRIMLKNQMNYRVYSSDEILSWHTGYDYIKSKNNIHYKYYIEFRVNDLDNPNPKAWFGGANQERDKWYSRVTTLLE